eukprot:TRINITY_DN1295_c0_g2_i11.p1 TRINITY_DN1295_c0_g2~~TRINITY_DN1295_c0_g2_i11.p1  ORF type:complete len:1352 (+),score=256.35 TRINITY_DN1295_c0_g2_i11:242-4057(+)
MTPLQIAAYYGNAPVMELLIQHGADMTMVSSALGKTLYELCKTKNIECTRVMLFNGFKADATVAMELANSAALLDDLLFFQKLERGIKPGVKLTDVQATGLSVACANGAAKIILYLLEKRVNPDTLHNALVSLLDSHKLVRSHSDTTPRPDYALPLLRLLLAHGAELRGPASGKSPVFHIVAQNGWVEGLHAMLGALELDQASAASWLAEAYADLSVCGFAANIPTSLHKKVVATTTNAEDINDNVTTTTTTTVAATTTTTTHTITKGCNSSMEERKRTELLLTPMNTLNSGMTAIEAVNALNAQKMTPIMLVVQQQHMNVENSIAMAKALVNAGASLSPGFNSHSNQSNQSAFAPVYTSIVDGRMLPRSWGPIHAACAALCSPHARSAEGLFWLVASGVDVNQRDVEGYTPLHYLCSGLFILNATYSPKLFKSEKQGIIMLEVVERLITAGADVHATGPNGETPMHLAARCSNIPTAPECVRLLSLRGADIDVKDQEGNTPIMVSAKFGSANVATLLANLGADLEVSDNQGETLASICKASKVPEIKALFEQENVYIWSIADKAPRPLNALSGQNVAMVATGNSHSFYLTDTGQLFGWGGNKFGQVGEKAKTPNKFGKADKRSDIVEPTRISALEKKFIKAIGCGGFHSVALDDMGNVYSWGQNTDGRAGQPEIIETALWRPSAIEGLRRVFITQIAVGNCHNLALSDQGQVYSWGLGFGGRLGHGNEQMIPTPTLIDKLIGTEITQISCGNAHSVALSSTKIVYSWGVGLNGRLGHGDTKNVLVPTPIDFVTPNLDIVNVECGGMHTLLLSKNGQVYSFGSNNGGQLGRQQDPLKPGLMQSAAEFKTVQVACGGQHSLLLTDSGEVHSFGVASDFGTSSLVPLNNSVYKIAAGVSSLSIAVTGAPRTILGDTLKTIFVNAQQNFGDVSFSLCGRTVNAHRVILAARSPLFHKLLSVDAPTLKSPQRLSSSHPHGGEKEKETEYESDSVRKVTDETEDSTAIQHVSTDQLMALHPSLISEEALLALIEFCYTDQLDLPASKATTSTATAKVSNTNSKELYSEIEGLGQVHNLDRLRLLARETARGMNIAHSSIFTDLAAFVNNPTYSDFVFQVQGQQIYAHKVILCARAPSYFETLFHSGMRETTEAVLHVEDVEYSAYLAFLTWVYTDKLDVSADDAVELLALSNQYHITRLQQQAESVVIKSVDIENVAYVWKLSVMFHTSQLQQFCTSIICKHFAAVQSTDAFASLSPTEQEHLLSLAAAPVSQATS